MSESSKAHYSNRFFQGGFTLVEILLVALLLSVIAGLTIPNYGRTFHNVQLKNDAQNIVYLMRYAQGRAVTKSTKHQLAFNADFTEYWLNEDRSDTGDEHFQRISGRMGKVFQISDTAHVKSDSEFIHFYPDGRIEGQYVSVCSETKCYTISTKEQRGHVWLLESGIEEAI